MVKIAKYKWNFFCAGLLMMFLAAHVEVAAPDEEIRWATVQNAVNQKPRGLVTSASSDQVAPRDTAPSPGNELGDTLTPFARGGGRDIYRITFLGAEVSVVDIAGDGASNLDLYVFDERGRLMCRAAEPTDRETCTCTPPQTAEFFVEVRNLGSAPNEYRMWTN